MNRLCNDKFLQSERPKITFKVNLHILAHVLFQQDQNCDDIIKENQKLKEEIKWLNDVITNNISQLAKDIMRNSDDIAANSATKGKRGLSFAWLKWLTMMAFYVRQFFGCFDHPSELSKTFLGQFSNKKITPLILLFYNIQP